MAKEYLRTKIGLEIHVQLKTKSKMFCSCDNVSEERKPNTVVCPVCLALPGALPVANKQAVLWTIKTGLALGCKINKICKFDRKHYFYPDLPKGYQISQYDEPFASGGGLKFKVGEIEKTVRLNRIHLEEDAGKLVHGNGKSFVDLNRAGTPLMEIVTEPDIDSAEQAGIFLRKLQKIVRDVAAVSEASMEKGHLRCDANISVSDDKGVMSEIVELKNINSFRFVEKALEIEEARLKDEYPKWIVGRKVTRGYDSKKNTTYPQRVKEEAADYRYFPEPDLPPFDTSEFDLEAMRAELGQNEEEKTEKLLALGVSVNDAKILANDESKEKFFSQITKIFKENEFVARAIVQNYFGFLIEAGDIEKIKEYVETLKQLKSGKISKALFGEISSLIHSQNYTFAKALEEKGGGTIDDESALDAIVEKIILDNPNEVAGFKAGKTQLIGFFVGQAMKATGGKADPKIVNKLIQQKLS